MSIQNAGTIAAAKTYKWATCGLCNQQDIVTPPVGRLTAADFTKEARRMGWQNTRAAGWICPNCAEAKRPGLGGGETPQ